MIEDKRVRPERWWLTLRPSAFLPASTKATEVKVHDYILTISTRRGRNTHGCVSSRDQELRLVGLARIFELDRGRGVGELGDAPLLLCPRPPAPVPPPPALCPPPLRPPSPYHRFLHRCSLV
jgi:hypothetical protein